MIFLKTSGGETRRLKTKVKSHTHVTGRKRVIIDEIILSIGDIEHS